jgi:hypothetical protein
MRMNHLIFGAALLLLSSCVPDTMNIGSGLGARGPVVGTIIVPTTISSDGKWHFSVSFTSGQAPYTISWNFGGGANPNSFGPVAATSPNSQLVEFTGADGTYTVTVTVTDSLGQSGTTSSTYRQGTGEYTPPSDDDLVLPPPPPANNPPVLQLLSGDGTNHISIQASDADGESMLITAYPPTGAAADNPEQTVSGGAGELQFDFSIGSDYDYYTSGVYFVATDTTGEEGNYLAANLAVPQRVPPNTIYAVPLQETAAPGEAVTIVVFTSIPDHSFQFMNGCRVTAPTGFSFVRNSFNVGAPGGEPGTLDGLWLGMLPASGFLLPPDGFIVESALEFERTAIDFNVTPVGGHDVEAACGALFNFQATFVVGKNHLSFQSVSGVSRTYYTDSNAAPDRFWGDIANNHPGIPNSVEVE